jgi:hypothetical protein
MGVETLTLLAPQYRSISTRKAAGRSGVDHLLDDQHVFPGDVGSEIPSDLSSGFCSLVVGQLYQIHLDRNPQSTQQIGSKEERPFQDYNGEEIVLSVGGV